MLSLSDVETINQIKAVCREGAEQALKGNQQHSQQQQQTQSQQQQNNDKNERKLDKLLFNQSPIQTLYNLEVF